ncbi:MAG TPA: hypothetical protein VFH53_06840, partial [Phycisphaerae bacterium]|nr:hypothetical protein [Phycisphaerae bacterium]
MKRIWLSCLILLLLAVPALGVPATITSFQTGPWNATATWVGETVPTSEDVGIIANGHIVTIPDGVTASFAGTVEDVAGINISAGGTLVVASGGTVNIGPGLANLTNSGTLTVASGGVLTVGTAGAICHGTAGVPGATTIAGTLTVTAGGHFKVDIAGATCTVSGAVAVGGTSAR